MAQQKNTKVEGIIISKTIYRDRDLICHVLLRNGKKLPVLFFGGRGGGNKQKSSLLELGYMLKMELRINRTQKDLYTAKEWSIGWHHTCLRNNHRAFYLMCLFFELVSKIVVDDDSIYSLVEEKNREHVGIFRVVSNAVFYLEQAVEKNHFDLQQHKLLFLTKLIFELGISPNTQECVYCGQQLVNEGKLAVGNLVMDSGGFSCASCEYQQSQEVGRTNLAENYHADQLDIFKLINQIRNLKYADYLQLPAIKSTVSDTLFRYLCLQFQLDDGAFKTLLAGMM